MTSDDAFRMIHAALGAWVKGSLEDGFQDDPLRGDHTDDLLKMANILRDIERHTDVACEAARKGEGG